MSRKNTSIWILLVLCTVLTSTMSISFQQPQQQSLFPEAAAQIIPDINVQQTDDCLGDLTVCNNEFTSILNLQGDIEGDASIIAFQANTCQDGADCSNTKTDTLTASAADTQLHRFI